MKAAEIINPAWDIWCRIYGPDPQNWYWLSRSRMDLELLNSNLDLFRAGNLDALLNDGYHVRSPVCDHMSFAIPAPQCLDLVAEYGPIVEIGAGTGYWAWCLRQMGVDVIAFDRYPPQTHPRDNDYAKGRNAWFRCWWTDVLRGDATHARRYPDRSLLLVWPYMDDMAVRALNAYTGDTVIFVGEERAACANEAFFLELEKSWDRIRDVAIPQWPGIHDEMWVLKRRQP